ncbi:MAG: transporter [Gemmatimonadota bacterium]|nr:transporter [Gemmatimonadota bacterium]
MPHKTILSSVPVFAGILMLVTGASVAGAQTDYYNTDAGRPITVEDAYPTERYAFEFQLAPVRLERARGGLYSWEFEPEIAYGILPRTHLELGLPVAYQDAGGGARRSGIAGLELSALHNLNAETSWPALGVAAEVLFPVGPLAYDDTYGTVKGIMTRTFTWARFHANGAYTFGNEPRSGSSPGTADVSRWLGGLAVDKTFPLRALLITAEAVARQPIFESEDVEWSIGTGARYQLSPQLSLDGGIGKVVTGDEQPWFVTFGLARAFGIRSLFPSLGGRR